VQQITVSSVHFDGVDTESGRTPRSRRERLAHARKTRGIERERRRFSFLVRNRRGCVRLPAAFSHRNQLTAFPRHMTRCLAPRVRQLHRDANGRMLADGREHRLEGRFGGVVPQAQIGGRDASVGFDCGRFDAEHAGPRERQLPEMDHVPGGCFATFRGVLAHRRNDDAIRKRHATQRDGGEQRAHGLSRQTMTGAVENSMRVLSVQAGCTRRAAAKRR
jgi:hypothetical protein